MPTRITRAQANSMTNIFSYFFMTRHALRHMKERSKVINTPSSLVYVPDPPTWLDYISKGVVSFTRGLAMNLVDKKIRVNGVAPGTIWTTLVAAALTDEDIASYGSQVLMGRAGQPYEVANLMCSLHPRTLSTLLAKFFILMVGNRKMVSMSL